MSLGKILIVDDDRGMLKLLDIELSGAGYEVMKAERAREGIEKAKMFSPDLILMDMMLPDIKGEEAAKILKRDLATKDIPVIFLTAMFTKEEVSQGQSPVSIEGQLYDLIAKPFDHQELLNKVKAVFGQKKNREGREK